MEEEGEETHEERLAQLRTQLDTVSSEYAKYREKTSEWKRSAKQQLDDAATKNKALRDELARTQQQQENQTATLRVKLDKEFRERTALKDEVILQLETQIRETEDSKRLLEKRHEQELNMLRSQFALELDRTKQQLLDTEKRFEDATKATRAREAKGGTSVARRLMEGWSEDDGNGEDEDVEERNDASASRRQEGSLERDDGNPSSPSSARRPKDLQEALDAERLEMRHEVARRDEQLQVLGALLQQARQEAASAMEQLRMSERRHDQARQQLNAKLLIASTEAAKCRDELASVAARESAAVASLHSVQQRVRALEEESRAREDAVHLLLQGEDDHQLVETLQRSLQESQQECLRLRQQCDRLIDGEMEGLSADEQGSRASSSREARNAIGTPAKTAIRVLKQKEELRRREEAIEHRCSEMDAKAQVLKALESKLVEQKREIAQQATIILQHTNAKRNAASGGQGSSELDNGSVEMGGGAAGVGVALWRSVSALRGRAVAESNRPATLATLPIRFCLASKTRTIAAGLIALMFLMLMILSTPRAVPQPCIPIQPASS